MDAPPITDREFRLFQSLVRREAGICLSPAKKALLIGRLSARMRELKVDSFIEYHRLVMDDRDGAELVTLLDCVTTNETQFFREPRQFEFLVQRLVPEWVAAAKAGRRPRSLRIWSAACATGEEPYSLAMALFPEGLLAGWGVSILASDLSTRALEHARKAVWPSDRMKDLPPHHLKRFVLRGTRSKEGRIKMAPEIRARVDFERINLNSELPSMGTFDVVFCRNVLIYFDAATKARVLASVMAKVAPGGCLFLGHAETMMFARQAFRSIAPNVYTRIEPVAGNTPGARARLS